MQIHGVESNGGKRWNFETGDKQQGSCWIGEQMHGLPSDKGNGEELCICCCKQQGSCKESIDVQMHDIVEIGERWSEGNCWKQQESCWNGVHIHGVFGSWGGGGRCDDDDKQHGSCCTKHLI